MSDVGAVDLKVFLKRTNKEIVIMSSCNTQLLTDVTKGSTVVLHSISAGRKLSSRLSTMGLIVGTSFKVIDRSPRGALVLAIRGTRLALGAGAASKIIVVPDC